MAYYRKLGRKTSHRNLMLRNLTTDVLRYGKITTTVTRAKETRRMVEKMITLGKRGDLSARRAALAYITDEEVVKNHQNSKKLVAQVMNLSLLLPSLMPKKPVAKSMWQIYSHNKKEMVFLPLLIPM